MYSAAILLTLSASIVLQFTVTSASPVDKRWYPESLGATYFQTNGFSGNQLVASYILPKGNLVAGTASWTYGNGSAGINDPAPYENHPDPFYGSNSVLTSNSSVYVVNAGSNTFSSFSIPSDDPARPVYRATYPSYGEFPVSLAASPDGSIVCVLNAGAQNGFACYRSQSDGSLAHDPTWDRSFGLNLTTPPHGPVGGTPSMMAFSSDMTTLLIAIKGKLPTDLNNPSGTLQPGEIQKFAISGTTLSTTPLSSKAGVPFSLEEDLFNPNQWFSSDVSTGYATFQSNDANSTVDVMQGTVPGEAAICWSAQSKRTQSYYVVDIGGASPITEISIDSATLNGTVVSSHHLGTNASGTDNAIASLPSYDYMWVLAPAYRSIHTYEIASKGKFNLVQRFNLRDYAHDMGLQLTEGFAGMAYWLKY